MGALWLLLLLAGSSVHAWTKIGDDLNGEAAGDRSGFRTALSADGSIVAVSSTENVGQGSVKRGHVRIYQIIDGDWIQLGGDLDGEADQDAFGHRVQLSADGTIVAVGAFMNDGNGLSAGQVRVFKYGSDWVQLGEDINGEAAGDNWGFDVALSADGLIVASAAKSASGVNVDSGHVRIFEFVGNSWQQLGSIDGQEAGEEVYAVALSGDGFTVAMSTRFTADDAGHVAVFEFDGTAWTQLGENILGEAAGDRSGQWIDLSSDGTILAIGALYNDGNGADSGHARVYQYASEWAQLGGDIDGEAPNDHFGLSLALSDSGLIIAVGARFHDGAVGSNAGHVRIFEYTSAWSQVGEDIQGEAAGDQSGDSVAISADGSIVAIGSRYNDGNGPGSGHVRVYEKDVVSLVKTLVVSGSTLQVVSGGTVIQSCTTGACDLSGMSITGTIPTEVGLCTSIVWLYLGLDHFTDGTPGNDLVGTIPTELGALKSSLQRLQLDGNTIEGTIPSELGELILLDRLRLEDNGISGTIPTELGELVEMKLLYLGSNELVGTIPTELGLLTVNTKLRLDANGLTGQVPSELAAVTTLDLLYLFDNDLTGDLSPLCDDFPSVCDARFNAGLFGSCCRLETAGPAPTAAPTEPGPAPTPAPTPPVVPTPVGSSYQPTHEAECADSTTWHKNNDPSKDCDWVAKATGARCRVKDEGVIYAFEECRQSCGSCGAACVDDPTWKVKGMPELGCAWVKFAYHRCSVPGDEDGVGFAYDACRRTCGTCDHLMFCAAN